MTAPITTLVVDNDAEFATVAAELLERESSSLVVETATSGREALDRLEAGGIDCIVSDYEMPGTDGLELLEAVRERDSELPFILFTGRGSEEIASEAIAAGVTGYLRKEASGESYPLLANQITNAVSQYRTRAELRENKLQYERTLAALHETTRELMRAGTKTEMYRTAVEAAAEILEVSVVAAYSFEPTAGRLEHVVSSEDVGGLEAQFERGESSVWEAFSAGEPRYHEDVTDRMTGAPFARSELVVPLGTHGVLLACSERVDGFDETMTELLYILSANAEAALDRAEREELLRERERTLTRKNEELTRLDHANRVVREINRAVTNASTRREIESAVCDRLAETDRYLFAWIATTEADPPTPTAWAGIDATYVDRLREEGRNTPELALVERCLEDRRDLLVRNALDDPNWERGRREALTYGYQTVLAIPLVDDDRAHGALVVHATVADAIGEGEREVLAELGETIGHAIRSVERTRSMLTDGRVELELRCSADRLLLNRLSTALGGELSLAGVVDREDGQLVYYVDGPATEGVDSLSERLATVDSASSVSGDGSGPYEIVASTTPFVEILREYDARLRSATTVDGETTFVVSLPRRVDSRALVEELDGRYPDTELLARRETTDGPSTTGIGRDLADVLTDRQLEALQTAHYSGFFEWPRESTGERLADAMDITPPTYHYHLRAAERKLVELAFDENSI